MDREALARALLEGGHDPRLSWIGGHNRFAEPVRQAEARTTGTPMGDWFGANVDPRVGQAVSSIDRGSGAVVDVAKNVALQPVHTGQALAKAVMEPTIGNMTEAGVQSAMMIPTAKGVATAGGITAAGLGALGVRDLLMPSPATAQSQTVDIPTIKQRIGDIDKQAAEIDKRIEANFQNKKMTRAQTEEANKALAAEKAALSQERAKHLESISSQTRADADAATKAAAEKERAGKPFSERNPELAQVLMAGTYPLAGLAGNKVSKTVLGNVGKANAAAEAATDPAQYALARATADELSKMAPAKIAGGVAASASIPADLQMLTDAVDYKTMPKDTRAYKEAEAKFADPAAYAKALAVPLIGGTLMAGGMAGKNWAQDQNRARTAAMGKLETPDGQKAIAAADEAMSNAGKWRRVDAEARLADEHSAALTAQQRRLELEAVQGLKPGDLPPDVQQALTGRTGQAILESQPPPRQLPPPVPAQNPLPPTPAPQNAGTTITPPQQFSKVDEIWGKQYSPHARQILIDHLQNGGTIVKGAKAKDGGLTVEMMNDGIKQAAGGKGPGRPTTGGKLDYARELLGESPTAAEAKKLLKGVDPRNFVLPLAAGASASEVARQLLVEELMRGQQ